MTPDELVAQAQAVAVAAQAHSVEVAAYAAMPSTSPTPPAAPVVASAQALGAAAVTHAAVVAAYRDAIVLPVPPPATLTLVRKSPTNPQTVYGTYNFQFDHACVMAGGKVLLVWRGTHEFDAVTGAHRKLVVTNADGTLPDDKPENCGMAWAPGENVVYRGTGAA